MCALGTGVHTCALPIYRRVWLTFDDGPSDDTPALLDLLDAHGAKATFFLVGERAAARPGLVRGIVARGHGLGNHSHGHPQAWFWALGPARMRREIMQCQEVLRATPDRKSKRLKSRHQCATRMP